MQANSATILHLIVCVQFCVLLLKSPEPTHNATASFHCKKKKTEVQALMTFSVLTKMLRLNLP